MPILGSEPHLMLEVEFTCFKEVAVMHSNFNQLVISHGKIVRYFACFGIQQSNLQYSLAQAAEDPCEKTTWNLLAEYKKSKMGSTLTRRLDQGHLKIPCAQVVPIPTRVSNF